MKLSDIRDVQRGIVRNGVILHLIDTDNRVVSFFSRDGKQAADLITAAIQKEDSQGETDDDA